MIPSFNIPVVNCGDFLGGRSLCCQLWNLSRWKKVCSHLWYLSRERRYADGCGDHSRGYNVAGIPDFWQLSSHGDIILTGEKPHPSTLDGWVTLFSFPCS